MILSLPLTRFYTNSTDGGVTGGNLVKKSICSSSGAIFVLIGCSGEFHEGLSTMTGRLRGVVVWLVVRSLIKFLEREDRHIGILPETTFVKGWSLIGLWW